MTTSSIDYNLACINIASDLFDRDDPYILRLRYFNGSNDFIVTFREKHDLDGNNFWIIILCFGSLSMLPAVVRPNEVRPIKRNIEEYFKGNKEKKFSSFGRPNAMDYFIGVIFGDGWITEGSF